MKKRARKTLDRQINLRVSAESAAAYLAAANAHGLTVGHWARIVLDHACDRVVHDSNLRIANEALLANRVR